MIKCILLQRAAEVSFSRHIQQANPPLAARIQKRCKMATKLEKALFMLKFNQKVA
jgi:hypothetical protein